MISAHATMPPKNKRPSANTVRGSSAIWRKACTGAPMSQAAAELWRVVGKIVSLTRLRLAPLKAAAVRETRDHLICLRHLSSDQRRPGRHFSQMLG